STNHPGRIKHYGCRRFAQIVSSPLEIWSNRPYTSEIPVAMPVGYLFR
ncbi:MAG: hypothetical protein ACI9NT_001512, partial [Bacteroidia bacterium]